MEEQRTVFQKTVLIILAAMIVVFGGVTAYCQTIEGVLFRDKFLRHKEVTDADCFTGKVEGEQVTILRWYGDGSDTRKLTLQVGERFTDTYTVYLGEPLIPPAAMSTGNTPLWNDILTLRVTQNDRVIFEGGYRESSDMFFTSQGEIAGLSGNITLSFSTGKDFWEDYTMPARTVVGLALSPELVDRGDWRIYGMLVFFTLLIMVDVAFPYTLFRWRYRRAVKNPEPTDDYMSMQHLSWVLAPLVLLAFYIFAATTTMAVA